jgi:hypothetical protein
VDRSGFESCQVARFGVSLVDTSASANMMSVNNNDNSLFISLLFIISVLHQQPEGQLQMQHRRRTKE